MPLNGHNQSILWLVAYIAFAIISFTGGGCYVLGGSKVTHEATDFIKRGTTTRQEIIECFGQPTLEWQAERALIYVWETGMNVEATRGGWFEGYWKEKSIKGLKFRAFCIALDAQDRVRADGAFSKGTQEELEAEIRAWLKSPST